MSANKPHTQEIWHAFFSQAQKDCFQKKYPYEKFSNIYLTTDGSEVEITEVCKEEDSYNKKGFPDPVISEIQPAGPWNPKLQEIN